MLLSLMVADCRRVCQAMNVVLDSMAKKGFLVPVGHSCHVVLCVTSQTAQSVSVYVSSSC